MPAPLPALADDGLHLPTIKSHSLEKLRRHELYARLFATSMGKSWEQLAYVGLYSGAGRARVEETGQIVETAPITALRLLPGFTHYVFVDKDPQCTDALRKRIAALNTQSSVTILTEDVNASALKVRRALPHYSREKGLLSFCFVDPFAADVHFDTFRALSDLRIDFLILLMLGVDARRNFIKYWRDPSSTRIDNLIACPTWREEFGASHQRHLIPFLLRKFDDAMVSLSYRSSREADFHRVTVTGKNVFQYVLAFYSKHTLGQQFWRNCLATASDQGVLDLQ